MDNCGGSSFPTIQATIHHYRTYHHLELEDIEKEFNSEEDFFTWKKDLEKTTDTRFIINKIDTLKSGTHTSYICHRSGNIVIKVPNTLRKRKLKIKGSKKLHGICPASMKLFRNADGKYKVIFCGEHVGHDIKDKRELHCVSLHKDDRLELASKIGSGVPLQRIMNQNSSEEVMIVLIQN